MLPTKFAIASEILSATVRSFRFDCSMRTTASMFFRAETGVPGVLSSAICLVSRVCAEAGRVQTDNVLTDLAHFLQTMEIGKPMQANFSKYGKNVDHKK